MHACMRECNGIMDDDDAASSVEKMRDSFLMEYYAKNLGVNLASLIHTYPPLHLFLPLAFPPSPFFSSDDMYAQDSIDLLTNSGINFAKHEQFGIDVEVFGEVLTSSGLVLLDDVKWISFHSGYDFGYLLKVLTCHTLPVEESDFFTLLKTYFPCIYDIKFLMKSCKTLKGGLQEVADDLKVRERGGGGGEREQMREIAEQMDRGSRFNQIVSSNPLLIPPPLTS